MAQEVTERQGVASTGLWTVASFRRIDLLFKCLLITDCIDR